MVSEEGDSLELDGVVEGGEFMFELRLGQTLDGGLDELVELDIHFMLLVLMKK